ncbi:helix-turn-helix transcriptional regulator [Neobacillus sp. OS1-33]|uniref:helix-turn-helix domain-containing protein n=1 Tax=Neobacillus sp. OS1-33 TaxID=3070683 RepID=UPI0027E1A145|nr:helix-turn-helix transcriptional regulator [Neobacillus sp. OS1-33]WML24523.1 helix-turn-helix transcriptional regulator [Neobacillus sp. OS1-33]
MSLSEKLRELRDNRNWSQQTLADMMRMDRSTVSRYETGRSIPNYQTVVRFAEIYQVDKEYLVEELDQLLPKTEGSGFIAKETSDDRDLLIINQFLLNEPDFKMALIELYLMPPKRRSFYIDSFISQIKVNKHHKDKF